MKKVRILMYVVLGLVAVLSPAYYALAHCQIPCGIYDDGMRFTLMKEHVTTVTKAIRQIEDLSSDAGKNANQVVRWTMNKEDHADQLSEIVTQYFLQQRIKPTTERSGKEWDAYVNKLRLCHEMLVTSMKVKQTVSLEAATKLGSLVDEFEAAYSGVKKTAEGSGSR
jgi:nickel superoxide dismutase